MSRLLKLAEKMVATGLFVGLNKGHVVTKREQPPRPNNRKGVSSLMLLTLFLLLSPIWFHWSLLV